MSGEVFTYDARNVHVIVGGVPMSGFADETFVSIAAENDLYEKSVGADGDVSRSRRNDDTGVLTLTLKQTSQSNDVLSALLAADRAGNGGLVDVLVQESGSGRTIVFAQAAWIKRYPNLVYGPNVENREWQIDLAGLNYFIGGNAGSAS